MHIQPTSSLPISGRKPKYRPTATPTASREQINCQTENAFGTYLHGVFDAPEAALRTAQALAQKKGVTLTGEALDTHAYKEQQYDKLADSVRKSLNMEWIYRIMEGKA